MHSENIEQRHQRNHFAQHIQTEIIEKDGGYSKVQLQTQDFHTNPNGQIHGGALFTLADIAAGTATVGEGYNITTVDSTIHYLFPGKPGDTLTAHGNVVKSGRTLVVVDVDIYNQDNKHLCHSIFTFFKLYPEENPK